MVLAVEASFINLAWVIAPVMFRLLWLMSHTQVVHSFIMSTVPQMWATIQIIGIGIMFLSKDLLVMVRDMVLFFRWNLGKAKIAALSWPQDHVAG